MPHISDETIRKGYEVIRKETEPSVERIIQIAIKALHTDGEHHKQWFLEQILDEAVLVARKEAREGIPP
jgi:hypothetical protein